MRKRFNEEAYTIRFTPRKTKSIWSAVNIKRVRELISRGRMQPAGLNVFRSRDERRARQYSYEREEAKFDRASAAALRANQKAAEFFEAQPPGYRKQAAFWVMSGKKEETRARRLATLIERSAKGKRHDMLRPSRK